ncbi:MAG: 50S ribosomal protein L24 [Bdellovibrionales bacterium]|nr:50S ribosomal protein L24 [Bdellovibrionales bacterium]
MKQARANKAIKKGDMVKVIAGRSKNKTGKITKIIAKHDLCLVEKVNMVKKHTKPSQQNPQGGIIEKEGPIHLSNVTLISAAGEKSKGKTTKEVAKKPAAKKKASSKTKKAAKKG